MIAQSPADQQLMCDQISEVLTVGAVDREQLMGFSKDLSSVLHDLSWEIKGELARRDSASEVKHAERCIASAKSALAWADSHSTFALTFELARCIEIANSATAKVVKSLEAYRGGAAA
jgi:hypothetical protein